MKKVIVDANIAAKWIIKERDTSTAVALLTNWIRDEVAILAPILLVSEVTNILHRKVKAGNLPSSDAEEGLTDVIFPLISFDLTNVCEPNFFLHTLKLARQFKLGASYDAHYLALAEEGQNHFKGPQQCEFWTADERLYNTVKNSLPWIHLMTNYCPPATPS